MNDIKIFINKIYHNNKYIIGFIIVIVILFLLIVKQIGKNTVRDSSKNTISESVYNVYSVKDIVNNNQIQNYNDVENNIKNSSDRIETFVLLCNQGKTDIAYDMLSDKCKEVLYPTKQDFLDSYYNVIYKTNKYYEISGFINDTYKVNYYESALGTGVETNSGIVDYITVTDDGKVSISGLVNSANLNIKSIGNYFTIKITNVNQYTDYQEYTVSIKNNTMADIYINNINDSNLYLRSNNKNCYYLNSSDYFDYDFLVPSKSEKAIKLKFNIKYEDYNESFALTNMCFDIIKIVNKTYLDSTSTYTDPVTGELKYEEKKTNYPEQTNYTVSFK